MANGLFSIFSGPLLDSAPVHSFSFVKSFVNAAKLRARRVVIFVQLYAAKAFQPRSPIGHEVRKAYGM